MREANPQDVYRYAALPHDTYAELARKLDSRSVVDLLVTAMAYLSSIAPPASNITTPDVYGRLLKNKTRCLNDMVFISSWLPRLVNTTPPVIQISKPRVSTNA
ncbi:hypothetical protein BOTBODRAFT_616476 [Botryobasidium botryosum FD-172 SS1]|uniref:Uncharacterized protein n=1 Tax=Botryobasidium botryosum (strain FD-172 SS1) TaxID=930990 RepID=A0A067LVE2_BOTB1|nr:hypothetical protein BOTBODRAFT_616476 [Botryobasidium botryosum FD-172 SS1]